MRSINRIFVTLEGGAGAEQSRGSVDQARTRSQRRESLLDSELLDATLQQASLIRHHCSIVQLHHSRLTNHHSAAFGLSPTISLLVFRHRYYGLARHEYTDPPCASLEHALLLSSCLILHYPSLHQSRADDATDSRSQCPFGAESHNCQHRDNALDAGLIDLDRISVRTRWNLSGNL